MSLQYQVFVCAEKAKLCIYIHAYPNYRVFCKVFLASRSSVKDFIASNDIVHNNFTHAGIDSPVLVPLNLTYFN